MKKKLTKSLLEIEYLSLKKGSSQIAKETGWSKPTVLKKLREFGITIRKHDSYFKDLSDQTFGKLKVINHLGKNSDNGRTAHEWECLCECGRITNVEGWRLEKRKTTGCGKCDWFDDIPKISWQKFKNTARHEITASDEYIKELFRQQQGLCALSGQKLTFAKKYVDRSKQTASLDRIDSSKPYEEGNLQWVHKDINMMKQQYSQEYFIEMCKKVTKWNLT